MSEKRLAFISCGGTIGMMPGEDGALSPKLNGEDLMRNVPYLSEAGASIEVIDLFNKDSTNVGPREWKQLTNAIAERHSAFDTFVVTHGTDSMAYTATAAALALGAELDKPVVVTGSQLPITVPRSDAKVNVESAAVVAIEAAEQGIAEVMVVFSHKVMRAARGVKLNEIQFDAFGSPAFPNLATLTADEEVIFDPSARRAQGTGAELTPINDFNLGVFEVSANATTDPEIYFPSVMHPNCTALVLRSVGAGNVPDGDPLAEEITFVPLIQETLKAGKPVLITSSFVGGTTRPEMYAPGKAALEAGAGHTGNMTDVAAKVKLMWLIGQGIRDPEEVSRLMLHSYVGEVSSPRLRRR